MKFPYEEKALLYRELAKLESAGFPLTEALDAVIDTHPPEASALLLYGVKKGLAESKTIGDSFADVSSDSPTGIKLTELEKTLIAAAERGGALGDGFDHLANYFNMRAETRKQMRRKMIYPLVLFHFAIIIPAIPLIVLSQNAKGVLLTSGAILFGVYAVLAFIYFFGRRLAAKAETQPGADRLLSRVPLLGRVRQNLALARFSTVYRMHLLAGERVEEGLLSAAKSSQSGMVFNSIRSRVIPCVEDGRPAGPALIEDEKVFTGSFARGFTTAEQAGKLDTDLARWADRFHEQARTSMDKLGSYAPKVFYVFIVVIVLVQILRLVLGIGDAYGKIFDLHEP